MVLIRNYGRSKHFFLLFNIRLNSHWNSEWHHYASFIYFELNAIKWIWLNSVVWMNNTIHIPETNPQRQAKLWLLKCLQLLTPANWLNLSDLNKISHILFAQFEYISYQCQIIPIYWKEGRIPKRVTFDINRHLKNENSYFNIFLLFSIYLST